MHLYIYIYIFSLLFSKPKHNMKGKLWNYFVDSHFFMCILTWWWDSLFSWLKIDFWRSWSCHLVDLYFSHVSPLDGKAFFLGEKLIFIKLEFPFIFIYFKKENKTLKKWLLVFGKECLWKPNSKSRGQVTY